MTMCSQFERDDFGSANVKKLSNETHGKRYRAKPLHMEGWGRCSLWPRRKNRGVRGFFSAMQGADSPALQPVPTATRPSPGSSLKNPSIPSAM